MRWVTSLFGEGKGHVVLAAIPNIWMHKKKKTDEGVGRLQRPTLLSHTKGPPGLTQHKINAPSQ